MASSLLIEHHEGVEGLSLSCERNGFSPVASVEHLAFCAWKVDCCMLLVFSSCRFTFLEFQLKMFYLGLVRWLSG